MKFGVNVLIRPHQLLKIENALSILKPSIIRLDIDRTAVEKQINVYDFKNIDRIVNFCKKHNIEIVYSISYTPSWDNDKNSYPKNMEAWQNFIKKVIQRYDSHYVSIWNEPNLLSYYKGSKKDFIKYIWNPGIEAIRSISNNIQILGLDLAYQKRNWRSWIKKFNKIDIVSFHCYGSGSKIKKRIEGWNCFSPSFKTVVKKNKFLKHKPKWLTETGITSNKGEDYQVKEWQKILKIKYMDVIFAYELIDDENIKEKWGLFDSNGNPKKVVNVLKNHFWMGENK